MRSAGRQRTFWKLAQGSPAPDQLRLGLLGISPMALLQPGNIGGYDIVNPSATNSPYILNPAITTPDGSVVIHTNQGNNSIIRITSDGQVDLANSTFPQGGVTYVPSGGYSSILLNNLSPGSVPVMTGSVIGDTTQGYNREIDPIVRPWCHTMLECPEMFLIRARILGNRMLAPPC